MRVRRLHKLSIGDCGRSSSLLCILSNVVALVRSSVANANWRVNPGVYRTLYAVYSVRQTVEKKTKIADSLLHLRHPLK